MSFSVCLFTQIASLLQDSPDAGISPWRLRTASATEKLPKRGKSIRDFKQYCCDHRTVFVTVYFWNGTCLPKPLYTKSPLVSAALHNENFHCATGSLRLERASLHLVKRKGKRQRPALTQPHQHDTLLSYVRSAGKTQTPWKYRRSLLPKGAGFSRLRWRHGMLAAGELQAERENSPLSNWEIVLRFGSLKLLVVLLWSIKSSSWLGFVSGGLGRAFPRLTASDEYSAGTTVCMGLSTN